MAHQEGKQRFCSHGAHRADDSAVLLDVQLTQHVNAQDSTRCRDARDLGRSVRIDHCSILPRRVHVQESAGKRSPRSSHCASPVTRKLNIIPLWLCSAMWQCAIHSPGLDTSSRISTVSPERTSTVSFQTRLSSTLPSRESTRK